MVNDPRESDRGTPAGTCPECGGPVYEVTVNDDRLAGGDQSRVVGKCASCGFSKSRPL